MTAEVLAEQSQFKELVTKVFRRFCEGHHLIVLFAPIDNHGSDVWEAGGTTDFYRFISIAATPLHDEKPAAILHQRAKAAPVYLPNGEVIVECFYGGATDEYLMREREFSLIYHPMPAERFSGERMVYTLRQLANDLPSYLERTWKRAGLLTMNEVITRASERRAS